MKCFMVCCAIALAGDLARSDSGAAEEQRPEAALREFIRLLESKNWAACAKRLPPPDVYENEAKQGRLKELEEEIAEKSADWLKELRLVKDVKPQVDENSAKFRAKDKEGKEVRVRLVKHGTRWYLH